MLIATLPSADNLRLISKIICHDLIDGVRYNVGIRCSMNPDDTLETILRYTKKMNKKLFIDLKGRQLRITKWADPSYGDIVLNHKISVDLPAKVVFRGGEVCNIVACRENKIYVDPFPKNALGAGQAINILGQNLQIEGYLTKTDVEYINTAIKLGIHDYMLSFVEKSSDIQEVKDLDLDAKCVLKIESLKGIDFVLSEYIDNHIGHCQLMAARDDLFIQMSREMEIINLLEKIVYYDRKAILASNIFNSLKHEKPLSVTDVSDLYLMREIGYKHFMFDDTISHYYFDQAIYLWQQFINKYPII